MAKGIYDKKRPTPKKVSTFDTKIIWIVVIAILVITAGVVAAVLIDADARSFVGTVDGKRVPSFEYRLFLESAVYEMTEEAEAEEGYDADAYWTEEKRQEACDKAITDAAEFYGEYRLAVKNGCDLTKEEKTNVSNNLNYTINLYYQYYSSNGGNYTIDQIIQMATRANITYDELGSYEKFLYKQAAISKYLEKLQGTYAVGDLYYKDEAGNKTSSGEDAILAEYNANRDDYRRIELTSLVIGKETAPVKPTEVTKPEEPEDKTETSAEYVQYQTNLAAYEKYVEDLAKYEEDLKAYNEKLEETRARVSEIYDSLLKNGKYTGKGVTEVATGEKDEEDNDVKAVPDYTDATLEDIAAKEGALYASDKGAHTYSGTPASGDFLAGFAHSLEWEDEDRTAVVSTLVNSGDDEAEKDVPAGEDEGDADAGEDAAAEETELPEDTLGEDTETGDKETGDAETGDAETGDAETGDKETGDAETGDIETGDDSEAPAYVYDYTIVSITENGAFKETEIKLFEDDEYFYITKCTGILDIDTSTEEEPAEDAEDDAELSVRAEVINTLKAVRSDDDIKKEVADAGAKYEMKNVKKRVVKIVREKVFG